MTEPTMPAVFLSHGAPPLVDDVRWVRELQAWSRALPRPRRSSSSPRTGSRRR